MRIQVFIALTVILTIGSEIQSQQSVNTNPGKSNLQYVKDNFTHLYIENYKLFWEIVNEGENMAISCNDLQDTSNFLALAKLKKGNAEFNEYFMEVIENELLEKDPKCLFDALVKNDEETQQIIMSDLRNPLFLKEIEIEEIFKKFRFDKDYIKLFELLDDKK